MAQAVIISIGNELLNGRTVNTNATFIAQKLHETGIPVRQVVTIGDSKEEIQSSLAAAMQKAEVIITTGGLGPTHDDITKKAVNEFFQDRLVFNEAILRKIEERFRRRGSQMPAINRNQAMVPSSATLIDNPVGTAPGFLFQKNNHHVFVLPGVPREMKAMMDNFIIPYLQKHVAGGRVHVFQYRTTGIAESRMYEMCQEVFTAYPHYEVAFLPKFTGVDVRVLVPETHFQEDEFQQFQQALLEKIGKYVYTTGDEEIEAVVGALLKKKKLTIAVAESCTGGLLQDRITNVSGSSEYFLGGMVTYSNESKMQFLGVRSESLEKYGAVSEVVAREMAEGVRRAVGSHLALSTTGIAGPTGATPTKPVGLIYIGLATPQKTFVRRFVFTTDRRLNKELGAQAALEMLRRYLVGIPIEENSTSGNENAKNTTSS